MQRSASDRRSGEDAATAPSRATASDVIGAHIASSAAMRSSSGGCVSNRWLMLRVPALFDASVSSGSSIQRCAVAFDAEWTTVWSSFSFSSAEISPGG